MQTQTEENYLKAIYKLSEVGQRVSTSSISDRMKTKSASVTDMLKRLHEKGLVNYERYQGVTISDAGKKVALEVIRKHRLWEVFLVETLKFKWDEVHPIAEQLEHVQSKELVKRLEAFLGYPQVDPHGDPIPDHSGQVRDTGLQPLSELLSGDKAIIQGVADHTVGFLQYLEKSGLSLGMQIKIVDKQNFDGSLQIEINKKKPIHISHKISANLLVRKVKK